MATETGNETSEPWIVPDETTDGVWELDLATNHYRLSPRWYAALGYRPGELPPGAPGWTSLIHPDDLPRALAEMCAGRETRPDVFTTTMRVRSATGDYRLMLSRGKVVARNAGGIPLRMVGHNIDLTAAQPAAPAGELEAGRRRTELLEERLRQTQKLEAIGRLAGGIAHDFNNVLTAMLARLTVLRRGGRLADADATELLELAHDVDRAISMTRQLLQFSRQQPLQLAPIELNQLVERVVGLLRRLLGETVDVSLVGSRTPLWLDGDAVMIEQVIVNLCVNARDAMPDGGRLALRTAVASLSAADAQRHHEARPGRYACLAVEDNGCGMDAATMSRALEPFFTTKPAGHGVGLGLATTHGIARQHGGWVELESQVGRGTTARVFLPLRAEAGLTAPVVEEPPLVPGTETILLVEDEAFLRRAIVRLLRDLGYRVLDAADAAAALELWAAHRGSIAVLVTDLTMPGSVRGLELATRLRREQPSLEVILTSGYGAEPVQPEGLAGRRFAFIAKPWTPEALVRLVRECLGRGPA
jgi:signal transduction histidine kinase/CheY-like chemotaxis protein